MSSTFTRMRLGIAAAAVLMIAGGLGTAALLSRHDGTAPPRTWWDAPSAVTERPAKVWTWKPTTAADTIVPLDVADQVLVQAVSTTDMTTTFTALDDDGRASWSATLDGITYYAVAATPQSNLVAVSSYDTEATTVYDVPDGSVAWHARGVYRGSNQNVVSYARDAVLEVADSRTGKKLWSAAADASSFNPTELYTMSGSELDKRDPETGKELWRVDTGLQSDPTAPPQLMALDGFVAASTAEELRAYSDAGDPLWTIPLTSPATWVGPTMIAVAAEAEPGDGLATIYNEDGKVGRIPASGAYVSASGFYAHGSEYLMLADPVVYDSHLRRLASYPDGSRCAFADDGVYVLSGQGSLDYHPFDTSASGWHVHVDGSDSARASLLAMDDALIVSTGQTVTRWE